MHALLRWTRSLASTAIALAPLWNGGCVAPGGEGDDGATTVEGAVEARAPTFLTSSWALRGDGLTASTQVRYRALAGASMVRVIDASGRAVHEARPGRGALDLEAAGVAAGDYEVVQVDARGRVLGREPLHFTAPLYVVVSVDYDDTRFGDDRMAVFERLRQAHPSLRYTHYFAPYHYTDPQLTEARREQISEWVRAMQDRGDEVGLHLHTWKHYVDAVAWDRIQRGTWTWSRPWVDCADRCNFLFGAWLSATGLEKIPGFKDYSCAATFLTAYAEDELGALLDYGVARFAEHGLGVEGAGGARRPVSFRAGGWTADRATLRALERSGFTVDSSAVPAHWVAKVWGKGKPLPKYFPDQPDLTIPADLPIVAFARTNWATIDDDSRPYYPAPGDLLGESPRRSERTILEVPDNGCLVDYVDERDMLGVYAKNAPEGRALREPRVFQIGFHANTIGGRWVDDLDRVLAHVDARAAAMGLGPAVYATTHELRRAFRP